MHTISTPVRCLKWRAHVIIFRCFPIAHYVGCLFSLHKSPILFRTIIIAIVIIIIINHIITTSARGHHHRCTGTKRTFRIQLRYHQFFRLRLFHSVAKPRTEVSFVRWMVFLCVRTATEGATDVSNECVLMMIDWVLRVGLCEQFSLRIIIHLKC